MGIIEEVFYGKLSIWEVISKKIPDFSEYSDKVIENSEKIKKTLSEEQLQLLAEYDENLEELYALCEKQCFIEGFKIGFKLHSEIFQENFD